MILGGAQENTLLTCEGLHRLGHEVTLVTGPTRGPEGELMTRALAGGYRVEVLPHLQRELRPYGDWRACRQLTGLLRRLKPDLMHSHSSKAGILARQAAARLGGMKIVHTIHGLPFHPYQGPLVRRLYVDLERRAARQSDAIISVADAMTAQALGAGVGQPSQFSTIYSGMEVDRYIRRPMEADQWRSAMNLPAGAVLFTQVSRLAELKGHKYILEALGRVRDPRVHVCFVGDGHWRQRIEADISRRGLSGRLHLTGLLPPEQIPAILHASDVLVHCSLREGLSRAIPQAMLAGLPVISFDVDGAREVVNPNTGILLGPADVSGLAAAIDTLAGSADLRRRLGQAGQSQCRTMFDHNRMVQQIEALYRRLLG